MFDENQVPKLIQQVKSEWIKWYIGRWLWNHAVIILVVLVLGFVGATLQLQKIRAAKAAKSQPVPMVPVQRRTPDLDDPDYWFNERW